MTTHLILTIISDDKPGIVESLAKVIRQDGGNWLHSKMSRLSGKFAGIVEIAVAEAQADELIANLQALKQKGFTVVVEKTSLNQTENEHQGTTWTFSIFGNDRPGIIREVTQAFSKRDINLEELSSRCTSMPHVGTPMFEASGKITLPVNLDLSDLEEELDTISDELAIDIQLEEQQLGTAAK